jgi:hypothetical protein
MILMLLAITAVPNQRALRLFFGARQLSELGISQGGE